MKYWLAGLVVVILLAVYGAAANEALLQWEAIKVTSREATAAHAENWREIQALKLRVEALEKKTVASDE